MTQEAASFTKRRQSAVQSSQRKSGEGDGNTGPTAATDTKCTIHKNREKP
jgi:hypothetical protein